MSLHKAMSPNQREVISAVSTITNQQEYLKSTNGALVTTNSSGNNLVGIDPVGQSGVTYDTIAYTNTSSTVDTYTYKSGGTGGTTTATITITYTDTTKTQISTVVRT